MPKSFKQTAEAKETEHFRIIEKHGNQYKRVFKTNGLFTDLPLEEDLYLLELNLGFDDLPH